MCAGSITTVYTWVRDHVPDPSNPGQTIPDPLDNPPDEIITVESCEVKAWVYFWILGATVNCSNGLGFPTTFDYSFGKAAESKGTLYTRRSGGQTVTLTCSPSALAVSDEPDAWVELIYKSGIIVPRVELIGTTRFYTPSHAIKFLTGQQITGGVGAGIAGPFPMPTVTTRAWTVDNDPSYEGALPIIFKSYTHTNTLGQLNAHNSGDLAASTFSFYTADGTAAGRAMQVKCDLTFALPPISRFEGGLPEFTAKSKIVEAVKPQFTWDNPVDGLFQLLSLVVPPASQPSMYLVCGDAGSNPGQQWANINLVTPTPFGQGGKGAIVQLISADRDLFRNTTAGHYSHFVYNTTGALDTSFPYPYDPPQPWSFPSTSGGKFVDSPAAPLEWNPGDGGGADWYKAEANDSFVTWAMYRPPAVGGQGTEWIPIAKYEWSWQAVAEKQLGVWVITSGRSPVHTAPTPTNDFPLWTTYSPSPFAHIGVP